MEAMAHLVPWFTGFCCFEYWCSIAKCWIRFPVSSQYLPVMGPLNPNGKQLQNTIMLHWFSLYPYAHDIPIICPLYPHDEPTKSLRKTMAGIARGTRKIASQVPEVEAVEVVQRPPLGNMIHTAKHQKSGDLPSIYANKWFRMAIIDE